MRMKTGFAKQLLSILLCVTMLLTYVPTAAFAAEGTADSATLYLVPNEWTSDNAGLAVYYWTGTGNNWVKMEKVQDNLYKTVTPIPTSGLSGVIFVRHDSAQEPSWDSKWNQTADLTFSGTQNTATIPADGWDGTAVTWSHTHLGGTATCSEKAVCESCGEGYGDLNSDNHIYDAEGKCDCGLVCSHSSANTSDYTCTTCGNRLAAKWEKYTSSTLRGYKYYLTLDAVELTDTSSQDMFIILNDSVLTGTLNIGSCTFSNVNGATLTIQGDSLLSSKNSTGSYDWILCEASSMGAAGTQSFGSVETLLNNGLSVFLRQDKTVGNLSVNVFFKVPAGRTLTVNGTLTLGESAILQIVGTLAFGEAGRIVNSGTVQLPEGTSYAEIPAAITGGIVKIGTASYTWDNDQAKWICDESSHVGGIATCKERARCSACKQVYGYTDSTNHASTELTYTDNGDGTHLKAHACCGLSVNSRETHFLDSTTGKCACGYEMARAKVTSGGVDTYHETLSAALAAAVSGDTVSLCADVDIKTTSHTIPEGVTFSGGEYTISGEGAGWVYNNGIITDGKFTFFVDNRGTIKGGEFFSVSNSGAVMGGSFQGVDCKSGSSISGPVRISDLTYIEECSINLSEAYLTSRVRIVSANAQELPVSSLHLPEGYALQVDDSIVSVLPPWLYGFVVEHAHTYEKEEFDTSNHWMVCACGAATEKLGHSYTYAPNGENHTVGCAGCGYTGTGDHTVQSEATCIAKAVCKFCGEYGVKDATNHADTAPYDNGFCLGCDIYEPAVDSDNDGYYEISNAGQLYWFAQQVNAGNNAINGKLMKDIVVNAGTMTAETTGAREWIPISKDYSNGYSGTFEGNNKTISGLYLNNNELTHAGLFGHIDTDGKVQNVGVINSYIKDSNSLAYVGGISSYNHGTVLNCYNTGRVIGNLRGGGVVGYNHGTVTDCYNEGDVSGTSSIGGVVGSNRGTVTDCYNKGSINGSQVGGVVGTNDGDVTNCYNTGDVSSTGNKGGGVAGTNDGDVTNCYNTGTVSGTSNIGGVAGSNTSSVTSCYNIGTVSGTSNIGGVAGVNDGNVRSCYYLVGCGGTGYGNSRKEEAFKSGEVAYLLGEAFGQTISSQDYPVLGGQKVYYGYLSCTDDAKVYTNNANASATMPEHTGEATYTPKADNDIYTHDAAWSCCGTVVTEYCGTAIYTVSSDGATCTVTCEDCKQILASCTIVAPTCTVYGDGKSCEATVLVDGEPVEDSIAFTYYQRVNDQWSKLEAAPTDAGTYRAEIVAYDDTYYDEHDAIIHVEYTIEKKELTATVSGSMSKSYDGTNVVPQGHSLKIVLDGVISGDTVTASADFAFAGINAGTTTINATNIALSGKDAENYKLKETEVSANVGEIVPLDFNYLEPHDYEIVFGAEPIVYNGKEQAMTVESFVMCGMDVTYELNGNTGTEAGFYTMTVTATGNFAGTVTQGWQISKKAVTVTAKDQTITYGSTISDTEFTSAGLADGHSVTVTLMPSTANVTADGTITASAAVIAAGSTDVTANYEITYAGGKLVIEPDTSKIAGLTTENVTSANETDIKEVQEMLENADSVKDEWNAVTATCEDLLAKIGAAADATDTENTGKVENVTAENVKPENKEALEDAKADLEKALEANGGNYTESEKKTIQEQIDRIEAAVAALENVEKVTESIGVLPESVETDDEAAAEKILSVKEAYDALTDHEKSLVDEDVKKKLDALVAVLTAYDIIEGDGSSWTQGSNGTVSFTANGAFSKFVGIKVDGKAVDKANFEAKSGSTVITLKASYLATLAVGEHTLTVVYTDGSTDGTFKIAARAITPPTGDSSNIMLFGSMLTISLAGLIVLLWAARKRKPENA